MNPWIEMFSGTAVDLIQPDPETIRLDDIAHHIARIHRYTGGTEWSVAAHSLCVAMLVPAEFRLEALLHDAHEAYVGDVSSPMKAAMRSLTFIKAREPPNYEPVSAFDLIEESFERVVREKFGLPPEKSDEVHRADMVMRATERRVFLRNSPKAWEGLPEPTTDARVYEYMRHLWERPFGAEFRWMADVSAEMRKRDPAWGITSMLNWEPRWP